MPDWIPTFITELGPSNAIVLMFFMGIGVVLWVMATNRKQSKDRAVMWERINENTRLYNQVDKLEALNSLAIRFLSDPKAPIETMKQSADGIGNHALNRDV